MAAQAKQNQRAAYRSCNVDVSLDLSWLIKRFAEATKFDGDVNTICDSDGSVRGGEVAKPYTSLDAGRFAVDYMWRELLSKFDDGKSSVEKHTAALENFAAAEVQCGETNLRLSRMVGLPSYLATSDIERTLCIARRKLRGILGRFDWSHASRGMGFTNGASHDLRRTESAVPHKYSGTPETTHANASLAAAVIYSNPLWRRGLVGGEGPVNLKIVDGNRIDTVPKNYKTNRVIAMEPRMNMYVQRGIGALIRERLKRVGIDLSTQERNQGAAYIGSVTGMLATIDLRMASDTVSRGIVEFLCAPDWLAALERCRSPIGVLPSGDKVLYRKFSSMGNGYTFELETSIFLSLALAVCEFLGLEEHQVLCYGDDIVVPSQAAPMLMEVLNFCGFVPNESKTFVEGPFRESCGKHFFNGTDVQPIYIRSDVKRLTDLFKVHNKIYRWWTRQSGNSAIDPAAIRRLLVDIRRKAPYEWQRPRIPDGFGDGAFIGTFDDCMPRLARDGWEGYTVEIIGEVADTVDFKRGGWGTEVVRENKKTISQDDHVRRVKFRPSNSPAPTFYGRLLQSLNGCGHAFDTVQSTPFEGGVAMAPRTRLMKIIVDGFALDPALNCF